MGPTQVCWPVASLLLALGAGCMMPGQDEDVAVNITAVEVDCATVEPSARVEIANMRFDPSDVTVGSGGVVEWINDDNVDHTVTSGDPYADRSGTVFDSGNLDQGERYCLQLEGEGTVEYYCVVHPLTMQSATITVIPPADEGEEEPIDPGYVPPALD